MTIITTMVNALSKNKYPGFALIRTKPPINGPNAMPMLAATLTKVMVL